MAKSLGGLDFTMPSIYPNTFGEGDATAWDFAKYSPQVVVINLGTNDANAGVNQTTYTASYETLVDTVRGHSPDALVYCASQDGQLAAQIQAVVAAKADPR